MSGLYMAAVRAEHALADLIKRPFSRAAWKEAKEARSNLQFEISLEYHAAMIRCSDQRRTTAWHAYIHRDYNPPRTDTGD